MEISKADTHFMKRAITLARKGTGWVNPNPLVGAVLVNNGVAIGEGWHAYFGGPHAEVMAIRKAEEKFPDLIAGSTLYVTLEPCNHEGKTPPCTDLIIEKKIGRVVVGIEDPNRKVAGNGIEMLRSNKILIESGICESEIHALNRIFLKYTTTGMPYVLLKSAMTLDGKIATVTNASQWITGEHSRKKVHLLRHEMSAVMVGVGTILADNPQLNIRLKEEFRSPLKVIADSSLRIPLDAKVISHDPQLTLVATTSLAAPDKVKQLERLGVQVMVCPEKNGKVDIKYLFNAAGTMGIDSILLEGGSTLAFSAIKDGLVDKILTFVAPKLLGGASAPTPLGGEGLRFMEDAVALKNMKVSRSGEDVMIEAEVETSPSTAENQ
jgi:diaminohydroxyphosphoribosylaminopyrimidine deaminase/5-amino-6-(5-phosphoribosylamino)uracil reductase